MLYLITHAQVFGNAGDPSLTLEGETKTKKIILPERTSLIVSGTGKRHRETADIINNQLQEKVRIIYTPFCGTPEVRDYNDKTNTFGLFADGEREHKENYVFASIYFNAWGFAKSFATKTKDTIFCGGHQFMDALNFILYYKQGEIFVMDSIQRTVLQK